MDTSRSELVVLVPTLGRPHALEPLAQAFAETTPNHRLIFIVDVADSESRRAAEQVTLRDALQPEKGWRQVGDVLVVHRTGYPAKINAGIRATSEPFILLAADDVRPQAGWFETAKAEMTWRFAPAANVPVGEPYGGSEWMNGEMPTGRGATEGGIGFVSCNDLGNRAVMRGRYATTPLIARWYCEKYGELLHEGYRHNCCDVEASELAQKRGAFAYAPKAVVEHLHPLWNKSAPGIDGIDQTYADWALDQAGIDADRALLDERRKAWT
jgi:hypothetical protein